MNSVTDRSRVDTAALLSRVDIVELIGRYVPLSKSGAEFEACCPFHTESTPSFKVHPVKQFYHCFGCGANGDAIGFLVEHQGLSFLEAVAVLGGAALPDQQAGSIPAARQPVRGVKEVSPWVPILPVPACAGEPPKAHIKRGLPEATWLYRDSDGAALGYIYRFKKSDGGKETLPLVWARNSDSGVEEWHWMAFPEPRPLFGLEKLAARPEATVLLVEGEKCVQAADASLAFADYVAVSWPGGGKAVPKAFWMALAKRKVLAWPDADAKRVKLTKAEMAALPSKDEQVAAQALKPLLPECEQPGIMTMEQAAGEIVRQGGRVRIVNIPAPGEKPDGWDVADAIAEGWSDEDLRAFIANQRLPLAAMQAADVEFPEILEGLYTPDGACAGEGEWRRDLLRREGKLIDCRENIYLMLRSHPDWLGVLWVDEFARRIVKRRPAPWDDPSTFVPGTEWVDHENLRLGLWLAQREKLLIRSAENLSATVSWLASESPWHPVREYLDGLQWDGVSRVNDWLSDFLGVKSSDYSRLAGRLFLIGMVARIYRPGCQMRAMPILEGVQFRGKSTAMRILGGEWYGDSAIDLNNKDSYQLIQGCWLYEIAELDAFNRAESTRIKAFISSQEDRFRAPYERSPRDHLRQTVFVGTTNQDEYFKDQTGNTRYWPLRVDEIDHINLDGLASVRDQLFAEALVLYRDGQRWHPTRDEQLRLFEPEQVQREIADPWQSLIVKWLRSITQDRVTVTDILSDCLKIEAGKIDSARQMSTRVGIAMKRIAWIKKRETGGDREYFYFRPDGWGSNAGGGDESF